MPVDCSSFFGIKTAAVTQSEIKLNQRESESGTRHRRQVFFFLLRPNSTEEKRQRHVWSIISKTGISVDLICSKQMFFAISMTHDRKSAKRK